MSIQLASNAIRNVGSKQPFAESLGVEKDLDTTPRKFSADYSNVDHCVEYLF